MASSVFYNNVTSGSRRINVYIIDISLFYFIQTVSSFLDAGADIIKTSSYQASIEGFVEHLSLSPVEAHDLIVKSGFIAKEERDRFWGKSCNRKGMLLPGMGSNTLKCI